MVFRRANALGLMTLLLGGISLLLLALGLPLAATLLGVAALSFLAVVMMREGLWYRHAGSGPRKAPESENTSATWSLEAISDSASLRELLERVVTQTWGRTAAESIELEVLDAEREGVSSSITIGNPLADGMRGRSHRTDLRFAGEVVGRLSVKLPVGHPFSNGDCPHLNALARECTMLLVNARYTRATLPQRRESEQQVRVRSTFLANLSHELRSPMAIVLNASELLLEKVCGELTMDQEETLTMVKLNAEHLMELITDVLDYSRIEAGTLTPDPEVLSLAEQVLEVSKMVRSQAAKKQQSVRCRPSSEQFPVRFDRRHLRQALLNVLTNASKYTPEGGTIEVWVERAADDTFRVCVRDSGIGIAEEDRGRVFAAFERLDHPYARSQMGTGLGLSLTKKLLAFNGATIDFHSELGFGSTFWIEVPREEAIPVRSEREDESAPRASGERVLMVSPEDEERILVARYLRSLGYEILFASTEIEARQYLRSGGVSLVLLTDRFVPMSGDRFASFVRDEERDSHIPVLLLTRRAFLADVERYLREEVDRCLPKPVRLAELARACRAVLDFTNADAVK
jgi:signal transduction histidine kinase